MLPSAKQYLIKGGLSPKKATLILMACFLIGALGISVLSSILHKYIPHTIVDCDHEHGDEEEGKIGDEQASHSHHHAHERQQDISHNERAQGGAASRSYGTIHEDTDSNELIRRPSLHASISSKVTQLVNGTHKSCDSTGQCYGYSDTCGTECFKNVLQARPPRLISTKSAGNLAVMKISGLGRSQTSQSSAERRPLLEHVHEIEPRVSTHSRPATTESVVRSPLLANGHTTIEHVTHSAPHHNQSSKRKSTTTLHNLCDTINRNNSLFYFRRICLFQIFLLKTKSTMTNLI